jgi:hypothetical protein
MKLILITALTLLMITIPAISHAQDHFVRTGTDYADQCQGLPSGTTTRALQARENYAYCLGLITGHVQAVKFMRAQKNARVPYCTPAPVTMRQYEDILRKYVLDHPDQGHHSITVLMMTAFTEAFPCK